MVKVKATMDGMQRTEADGCLGEAPALFYSLKEAKSIGSHRQSGPSLDRLEKLNIKSSEIWHILAVNMLDLAAACCQTEYIEPMHLFKKGECIMNTKRWISVLLLVLLLTTTAYPALARSHAAEKAIRLLITNKTQKPVQIRLTGTQNKTITAEAGKTTIEIPSGQYKYEYTACGAKKSGNLKIKGQAKLVIAACKLANIKVVNQTGGNLLLQLTGPERYTFNLPPGRTKIKVLTGDYTYSATGCGGHTTNGTQYISGNRIWKWYCGR